MTALDDWRRSQHEGFRYPSDAGWDAFLASVDPRVARLDLAAHMTPVEARMTSNAFRRAS